MSKLLAVLGHLDFLGATLCAYRQHKPHFVMDHLRMHLSKIAFVSLAQGFILEQLFSHQRGLWLKNVMPVALIY
jgi:hypothetical protein